MKDYLIKFNSDGQRGTTYADGVHYFVNPDGNVTDGSVKVQDLLNQGFIFVDASDYANLLGNNSDYAEYCRQSDGTFAPYVAPEPTAEEQKAKKQAELQSSYESDKEALMKYYLAASLVGDADTQNELRTELTNLDAQFDSDMKALNE